MIICFLREQIEVFIQQRWFQVDMAFKRLKDPNQKEIVFAIKHPENNKSKSKYIYNIFGISYK